MTCRNGDDKFVHRQQAFKVVITLFWLFVVACSGTQDTSVDTQLIQIKKELNSVQIANQRLTDAYKHLQEHLDLLNARYENLKIKAADLAQWSRQLAIQYGPSVWYFSDGERPLPIHIIPHATPNQLIDELNSRFGRDGNPLVYLDKIENHTAYVHVSNDTQLTQQMGTTGATAYIQVVTYTLTSLKRLDFVEFQFKEGDHAIPGRYSR